MSIGKKLFTKTGAAFDPLANFETVTYTGNGGTQKITGYIRKGAAFNGSANITTTLDFNNLTNYTISMWIFVQSAPSGTKFFAGTIQNSGALNGIYFAVETDGDIRFYERNGSTSATPLISTDSINFGSWNHIVAVRDGSTNYLYINNGTPVSASNTTITHATDFTIGRAGTYTTSPLVGKIDQVRIFNRALDETTDGEVTTLYNEDYDSSTKSTTDIFDDGSGIALYEFEDNARSSNFGQAAVFNGSSSKIDVSPISGLSDVTFSCWLKSTDTSSSGRRIIELNSDTSSSGWSGTLSVIYTPSTGSILIRSGNASNSETSILTHTDTSLRDGNWHHLVVTRNETTGLTTLYIDGNQEDQETVANTSTVGAGTRIGNSHYSAGAGWLGSIDQIRIYSSALDSDDVAELYAESADVPTTNLVAHYKLDGNANDETDTYDGTETSITYAGGVYSGTPTNVDFLGMSFQPDLIWVKQRNATQSHQLADSVRGANKHIFSDLTTQQVTYTGRISSFDSNGFTLGSEAQVNGNGSTYVAWCWKAGGTVSADNNSDGSITSTVSANQDAGFSIVKYTGTGANATVGHGLSSAPELIIIKRTDTASSWSVYTPLGSNYIIFLNLTDAAASGSSIWWNNTDPTSSVFTIGTYGVHNTINSTNIAYCFHSVDGYQKVGSYEGNATVGNRVYTTNDGTASGTGGFKPRFVMMKNADRGNASYDYWLIYDSLRGDNVLYPNTNDDEDASDAVEFLSDGFEITTTSQVLNHSGSTYIYLAIA